MHMYMYNSSQTHSCKDLMGKYQKEHLVNKLIEEKAPNITCFPFDTSYIYIYDTDFKFGQVNAGLSKAHPEFPSVADT